MGEVTTIPKKYVVTGTERPQNPFEGQIFVDSNTGATEQYINGSWTSITADLDPVRNMMLDQAVDIAELNYAQGLNADSSDNIFVDPFVDMSKIASSSNVNITTGQNGNINLKEISYEGFEDSSNGFPGRSNTISYEGNYSAYAEGQNSTTNFDWNSNPPAIEIHFYYETLPYYNAGFRIIDTNNDFKGVFEIDDTGNISIPNSGTSLATKTWHKIELNFDWPNDTVEIIVNGNSEGTIGISAIEELQNLNMFIRDNGGGMKTYWDAIESKSYSSGTVTSTTIDKGFTPSSLQIDADIVTDSDTTVELEAYDGNGNKTTWTESELGDKKSVAFTDPSFQVDVLPSTSDSSKTPTVNDYGLNVIK